MMRLRQWLPWAIFVGFAVFLSFVIRIANTGRGGRYWSFLDRIPYGDKLGHMLLMGTLCFLLNMALRCRTVPLGGEVRIFLGTLLVALFVLGEEISQIFLPSRTFDFVDLLADAIGIALASWLAWMLFGKRRDAAV